MEMQSVEQLEEELYEGIKMQKERKKTEDELDLLYQNISAFLEDLSGKYRGTSLGEIIHSELDNVTHLHRNNQREREALDEEFIKRQKELQFKIDEWYDDKNQTEDETWDA